MIKDFVEKVKENETQFRVKFNNGVSDAEKKRFLAKINSCFGYSLPGEYLKFLDLVNGLGISDISIYGIDEDLLDVMPNQSVHGFINENESWSEFSGDDLIFLGDNSSFFYVYKISTGKYYILDRSDLEDECGEFESFGDMLESVIGEILE